MELGAALHEDSKGDNCYNKSADNSKGVPYVFIWTDSVSREYTTSCGYQWLLSRVDEANSEKWNWVWKSHAPENIKFMLWLIGHKSLPTRDTPSHRGIAVDKSCPWCGAVSECILHCLQDCLKSQALWHQVGLLEICGSRLPSAKEWIVARINKAGALFLASLWMIWTRSPQLRLICCCVDQIALNTDGSVNEVTAGFGGLLRHHDGSWISGFYGHLQPVDILEAELVAILEGLRICWHSAFRKVLCMTDSSLIVHLIHNLLIFIDMLL
ncbi:Ribonuclease H domain [Sesbania bispinosa]|nr:Ribonuclease H domain [Sesbania bispinosa]